MSKYYATGSRQRLKRKVVELHGDKCIICGYCKCLRSLQFHHVKPKDKKFNLGTYFQISKFEFLEESKKCVLICANCHGEIESKLIECPKINTEVHYRIDDYIASLKPIKRKYSYYCKYCDVEFETQQKKRKFCTYSCSSKYKRKSIRPSKEQLFNEIQQSNYKAVSRKYGVTDNTIRKWLKAKE